ncbi:protein-tyrosine phosphatase family protein [Yoonia sp. 208BN28-4]|uniref:protein-tyrosine phosphatase family protein n=1 Tax=Yoonia sp. 208BN28-4 TaxID=3126505 RepID=UPI0030B7324E
MTTDFAVYDLPVAGGTIGLSPLPGRGGDYAGDLARVLAWTPDGVVSLTKAVELDEAVTWHADLRAAGVTVWHLPIVDFGVPDDGFEADLRPVREMLAQGGRVLVHCKGGCGRSGMIALRLMVESGETAEAALARLRAVRPCAVETDAQFSWAAQAG